MLEKSFNTPCLKSSELVPQPLTGIQKSNGFIIIGHRGNNGGTSDLSGAPSQDVPTHLRPENTLLSFFHNHLWRDGNECDVYASGDGVIVICHDDALNLHVPGANRKGRELGFISESSMQMLSQINIGQGAAMPTLEVTLAFAQNLNEQRRKIHLKNIILNIELKGPNTVAAVNDAISKAVEQGYVTHEDIFYCSSNIKEIKQLARLNSRAKIALAINTNQFFGEDNVLDNFMVPGGLTYREGFFEGLYGTLQEVMLHAIDCTFWDINDDLINFAVRYNLSIHATAAKFHEFNYVLIDRLIDLHERLGYDQDGRSRLHFKSDCPTAVKEMMFKRLKERCPSFATPDTEILAHVSHDAQALPPGYLVKDSSVEICKGEAVTFDIGIKGRLLRPGQTPTIEKESLKRKKQEPVIEKRPRESQVSSTYTSSNPKKRASLFLAEEELTSRPPLSCASVLPNSPKSNNAEYNTFIEELFSSSSLPEEGLKTILPQEKAITQTLYPSTLSSPLPIMPNKWAPLKQVMPLPKPVQTLPVTSSQEDIADTNPFSVGPTTAQLSSAKLMPIQKSANLETEWTTPSPQDPLPSRVALSSPRRKRSLSINFLEQAPDAFNSISSSKENDPPRPTSDKVYEYGEESSHNMAIVIGNTKLADIKSFSNPLRSTNIGEMLAKKSNAAMPLQTTTAVTINIPLSTGFSSIDNQKSRDR